MTDLGNLGQKKESVVDTFGWFGETIKVRPNLSDLVLTDFAEEASSLEESDPRAMTFLKRQLRVMVDPSDFDTFWSLAIENGQQTVDMLAVMKAIIEATSNRPTALPSGSSGGQQRTVTTYPDVSSLRATPVSPLRESDRQYIESQGSRPDLNMFIAKAAEEREKAKAG